MHGFALQAHTWFGVFLFGLHSAIVSNGLCGYQNMIKTLIKKSRFLDWFVFCISDMNAASNAQIKCHKHIQIFEILSDNQWQRDELSCNMYLKHVLCSAQLNCTNMFLQSCAFLTWNKWIACSYKALGCVLWIWKFSRRQNLIFLLL